MLTSGGHQIDSCRGAGIDHTDGAAIAGKGGAKGEPAINAQQARLGVPAADPRPGRSGTGQNRADPETLAQTCGDPRSGLGTRHIGDPDFVRGPPALQKNSEFGSVVEERSTFRHETVWRGEGPFDPAIADVYQQSQRCHLRSLQSQGGSQRNVASHDGENASVSLDQQCPIVSDTPGDA